MKILPFSALALLTLCAYLPHGLAAEKPNIIIINIDDLGYADIGPFGSKNETPNLDRMAKEGRKLNSHYAAPVCSPSRAALMTGCYPKRVLSIPHVLFPVSSVGLNPEEVTIADLLKGQGYATACIGKWHLGDQPEFLPTRQGFDYYYGIPYSNDMGTIEDGAKSNPGAPLPKPKPTQVKNNKNKTNNSADEETGVRGPQQPPLALLKNETVIARVKSEEQFALTQNYTVEAKKFIAENKDRSFFLYFPHSAVHFPLYPSKEYMGKSSMGLLGDWVREVDWSVGQILDQLRELNLTEKTLVVFTSDNGGAARHGSINTPLRGNKGETFEGGIRVCTIAWWPGKIPADTETNAITSMMDLLPTCAHLAGASLPDYKIDGQNQWPILSGNPVSPPRDHFFYYRGHRMEAVRSGPWKLHLDKKKLFNLEDDIGESSDQYAAHADIVARLEKLALTMEDDLGLDGVGPGCRPLGRVSNPQPIISVDGVVREDLAGDKKMFP